MEVLRSNASQWKCSLTSREFAVRMDDQDPLKEFREKFYYPKKKCLVNVDMSLEDNPEAESIYLCGNSLGLQPKSTQFYIQRVLDEWRNRGVEGHRHGTLPFAYCDTIPKEKMANLVGARPNEIALMNGLSVNLHLLLASFYAPTPQRHKILIESDVFPSDLHIVRSQIEFHGYTPDKSLLILKPRQEEYLLRIEDIINTIEENGDSIAVILLPGVQYFTGQVLDVKTITEIGHKNNCLVGFDLAHTVGNVDVELHNWDVDFAGWCTYKYLNTGPGGISGIYVHERFTRDKRQDFPRLRGWWGIKPELKFDRDTEFHHCDGADMFKLSNPSPLLMCTLIASLELFDEAGRQRMQMKQLLLTSYLECLIHDITSLCETNNGPSMKIITPSQPKERGSQLSILFTLPIEHVKRELERRGVSCDLRYPVIRLAPIPLYNSYLDVYKFAEALKDILLSGS